MSTNKLWKIATGLLLLLTVLPSIAQIVIGQVATVSDVDSPGPDMRIGLQTYFDAVNHAGGVHGMQLKFVSKDRGLKASEAVSKTKELLAESEPLVLAGYMGTGPMDALVKSKLLEEAGIPLVGIRSGDPSLHRPVHPYLFHTRASYREEIQQIIRQLATIGLYRVAVFYEKSAFGKEGLSLSQEAIEAHDAMQLVHHATYTKAVESEIHDAVRTTIEAGPQSVVLIANGKDAAEFYKAFRAGGGKAQVLALSVVDGSEIVERIGAKNARGFIVTQVVPHPQSDAMPLVRELKANVKKFAPPGTAVTQAVVEGYLAAKTVVEALRIAGPQPTRKKVRAALESIRDFDAGGVIIGFSPKNHTGSKYVELSIVLESGRLMR